MVNNSKVPYEYTPISMWGYFGYGILFQIPVLGWIIALVFAFTAQNVNLRNFARAQFCVAIVYIILILIVSFSGLLASMLQGII